MKFLLIAGLFFFIGSIFLIYSNFEKFYVDKNGSLVKMQIKKLPSACIGSKTRYFVSLSYNGEVYTKATRGDFCDKHHVGEMIGVKWLHGSRYVLWPNESGTKDLISFGILGLFGLIMSMLQWRKMRKSNKQ